MPTDVTFTRYFADLPDPRVTRTRKHRLDDILAITLCAVICGADSFEEVERFGDARADWLKRFLALPHGIPSHDTFNRVLAALDPGAFAGCDMSAAIEDGHGRHEERYVTVTRDPAGLPAEWAGVGSVVVVGREREVGARTPAPPTST